MLYRITFGSPLGPMVAMATDRGLCALEFTLPQRLDMVSRRFQRYYGDARMHDQSTPILEGAHQWLEAYLAGQVTAAPALDMRGTDFELATWHALLDIAPGQTETYGNLARRLGRPTGARAVGHCVGQNPVGILVPCHRVVGQGGALTGYGGGLERKRWLLDHEQAAFAVSRQSELVLG